MSDLPQYTYVPRANRRAITLEPDTDARWTSLYPEMLGFKNQGGGRVAGKLAWPTNPKQFQEELTDTQLRNLRAGRPAPALPAYVQNGTGG